MQVMQVQIPKVKNVWLRWAFRLLLAAAFVFSSWMTIESTYHSIPYSSMGSMMASLDSKYFLVLLCLGVGLFFILLYTLFQSLTYRTVFRNTLVMGETVMPDTYYNVTDMVFGGAYILKGALNLIFLFNPLALNIGQGLVKAGVSVIACFALYFALASRLPKVKRPMMLVSLMMPLLIILLFL